MHHREDFGRWRDKADDPQIMSNANDVPQRECSAEIAGRQFLAVDVASYASDDDDSIGI